MRLVKEYVVSLTDNCNWNCWYCDFTQKKQRLGDVDSDYLKWFIEIARTIFDDSMDILVEGGEIGVVDRNILDIFFESNLLKKYTITTNGEFMKKNYHNIYKDKIHHILYHPITDVNKDDMTFIKYGDTMNKDITLYHTIVMHKNNIQYLDKFYDNHTDCIFTPHLLQPRIKNLDFLTLDEIKSIYNIIKDKENIYIHFKERMKTIIHYMELDKNNKSILQKMRYTCGNVYYKPTIDLPNKKIKRCCITIDNCDAVELTEENLIKLYNNDTTLFPKTDALCSDCISNFVWRHNIKSMLIDDRIELLKIIKTLR